MSIHDKKAFALSSVLMSFIAILFWTQSRFPALDEKAQMGQRNSISSIAFDVVIPLSSDQSYLERVVATAVNWSYTNWKGMTFGVLFAAAIWLLMSFVRFTSPRRTNSSSLIGHFKHAVYGALFGSPLGVCANCSTPIAYGMYSTGRPLATSLAIISSSPSFNFIVLGMAISLLPLELVVFKYTFVLIFILLVIPLLVWLYPPKKTFLEPAEDKVDQFCEVAIESSNWTGALVTVLKNYTDKLKRVGVGTVPFMVLAGVLAAFVAETVTLQTILGEWRFEILIVVAVLGAFFPVPIAFDVVISATLIAMGVDIAYVAALFFSLGVFSIYPALLIAKDISVRISLLMLAAVIVLSVLLACLSAWYDEYDQKQSFETLGQSLNVSQLDAYVLEPEKARVLMRHAARQCHQLGKPRQYECFRRFSIEHLALQFDERACVYLEDAVAYRTICNESFEYLNASKHARIEDNPSYCDALPKQYRKPCLYDEAFERVIDQQSILPCMSLKDSESADQFHLVRSCITEGLAINFELYENVAACDEVDNQSLRQLCSEELTQLTKSKKLLHHRDLLACNELNNLADIRYCQGVTMVNQLEQGENRALCDKIEDTFLHARCEDFSRYFVVLNAGASDLCNDVRDASLRADCQFNSILKGLSKRLENIQAQEFAISNRSGLLSSSDGDSNKAASIKNESVPFEPGLSHTPVKFQSIGETNSGARIEYAPHSSDSFDSAKLFQARQAESMGLLPSLPMKMIELFEPFSYGRGITSGDWNGDGWSDLVISTHDAVQIYHNVGGRFSLANTFGFGESMSPVLVLLTDLNADSRIDLFVTFYGGKNRVYWNNGQGFEVSLFSAFELPDTRLVMSAAVRDLDDNGLVDLVLGGWSVGDLRHFNPVRSKNQVLMNMTEPASVNFSYQRKGLKGVDGETLSVLLADFDLDSKPELVVGNDMDGPDILYRWQNGEFEVISGSQDKTLPWLSSFNTMSLASADINGDLTPDYFSSDMSFGKDQGVHYCNQPGIRDMTECFSLLQAEQAIHDKRVHWCDTLAEDKRADCYQAQLIALSKQSSDASYCNQLRSETPAYQLCLSAGETLPPKPAINLNRYLDSTQKNILLVSSKEGYRSVAEPWGAQESYWSWNSQFADVNNDGWIDLLIGNGFLFGGSGRNLQRNVLLLNDKGNKFEKPDTLSDFEDYLNMPSFVTIDYDRDGDLDVIGQRVAANLSVLENMSTGRSLSIYIRLSELGSRIVLTTNKRKLMRVVSQGGGFLSFSEPVAHFGFDSEETLLELDITWADGQEDSVKIQHWKEGAYRISK